MSLDVYLELEGATVLHTEPRIFVRVNGSTREMTREEWDERWPDREPVTMTPDVTTNEVYAANITHNLARMADKAGLYEYLWRPDELGVTKARELIAPLQAGLIVLGKYPGTFKALNPPNGWGTYEGLIRFVAGYLQACIEWPDATVRVWR